MYLDLGGISYHPNYIVVKLTDEFDEEAVVKAQGLQQVEQNIVERLAISESKNIAGMFSSWSSITATRGWSAGRIPVRP